MRSGNIVDNWMFFIYTNILYGQSSAKLPVIRSSGHPGHPGLLGHWVSTTALRHTIISMIDMFNVHKL